MILRRWESRRDYTDGAGAYKAVYSKKIRQEASQ
nr:MAG TPA: hypothetical protein [Herelleviridae sp.]